MEQYFYQFIACCVVLSITIIIVSICISKIVFDVKGISVEEFELFKQIVKENKERSLDNQNIIKKILDSEKNKN